VKETLSKLQIRLWRREVNDRLINQISTMH
jgi:hypothetical protein